MFNIVKLSTTPIDPIPGWMLAQGHKDLDSIKVVV